MAEAAFATRLAFGPLAGALCTFVACILAFAILAFGALCTFAAWILGL